MISRTDFENILSKNSDFHLDLTEDLKEYPYCMLLHYVACQNDENRKKSLLAILTPDRKRLQELFAKKTQKQILLPKQDLKEQNNEIIKEKNNIEINQQTEKEKDLREILNQRLAELNKNKTQSDLSVEPNKKTEVSTEDSQIETEDILFEPDSSISIDELIEKFNNLSPKRSYDFNSLEEDYKDLAKSSVMERTNIVSETLAELYFSQKAYDKAIKIYEALLTKYPEKNVIFANRMQEIKIEKSKNK